MASFIPQTSKNVILQTIKVSFYKHLNLSCYTHFHMHFQHYEAIWKCLHWLPQTFMNQCKYSQNTTQCRKLMIQTSNWCFLPLSSVSVTSAFYCEHVAKKHCQIFAKKTLNRKRVQLEHLISDKTKLQISLLLGGL